MSSRRRIPKPYSGYFICAPNPMAPGSLSYYHLSFRRILKIINIVTQPELPSSENEELMLIIVPDLSYPGSMVPFLIAITQMIYIMDIVNAKTFSQIPEEGNGSGNPKVAPYSRYFFTCYLK